MFMTQNVQGQGTYGNGRSHGAVLADLGLHPDQLKGGCCTNDGEGHEQQKAASIGCVPLLWARVCLSPRKPPSTHLGRPPPATFSAHHHTQAVWRCW